MIRIRGTLLQEHILLGLAAASRKESVQKIAESLRFDTRISDWQDFWRALIKYEASGNVNLHYGLSLPHVRSSAVTKILMAFGRLKEPLEEKDGSLQFVMLVGIPRAMDAEYLRLVGILMRVFRNENLRHELLFASHPADIIRVFEKGEAGEQDD